MLRREYRAIARQHHPPRPRFVDASERENADDRYGNGLQAASKKGVPGLYNTQNKAMGNSTGLKQYYRYGIYSESPFHHSILPTYPLDDSISYLMSFP
jgi:hypothetical protein